MDLYVYLNATDAVLSRTKSTGVANTGVSKEKKPLLVSGDALESLMKINLQGVSSLISARRGRRALKHGEFLSCLLSIAEVYSQGLLPESLFREWPYVLEGASSPIFPVSVEPNNIFPMLIQFDNWFFEQSSAGLSQSICSQVEWEIGIGPIHPFYDSCGRVSRYMGTLCRYWAGLPQPIHSDRSAYMNAAKYGPEAFHSYITNLPHDLVV